MTFVVFATLVLLAVAAVPYAKGRPGRIDSVTGWRVLSPSERIELARRTGNANGALSMLLLDRKADGERDPAVERALAVLRRELRPVRVGDVPDLAAAGDLADPRLPLPVVVDRIEDRGDDRAIATATEAFFDPHLAAPNLDPEAPDGRAMLLRRALRDGPQPIEAYDAVIRGFLEEGRSRAALRWLLRAFAAHPSAQWTTHELFAQLVAAGRLEEALAVARKHADTEPDDLEFYRDYARVAGWSSRAADEARALEEVVRRTGDEMARKRLLALYVHLRQPERGVAHARALAEQAGEVAQLVSAAESALQLGLPEQAIAMFTRLAERSTDPVRWRLRVVEVALQDLRLDRAIDELELLVHLDPEGPHAERLEGLYRRTGRIEALADLIEWRLAPDRAEPAAGRLPELVALRCRLGEFARARALENEGIAAVEASRFESRVDPAQRAELDAIRARAEALAGGSGELGGVGGGGRSIGEVLEELRPYLARPGFRDLAQSLLERFPDDPRARDLRIELVDVGRTPVGAVRAAAALVDSYPQDVEIARLWAERASWAGSTDDEIEARERVAALAPDDHENRRALVDLLQGRGEPERTIPHLETLVTTRGLQSGATPELVDALFACGRYDEATEWLRRLAEDPSATPDDWLSAARQLFFREKYAQARPFLERVLEVRPEEPEALLRLARIHAWANEPAAAAPLFARRLAVTSDDAIRIGFAHAQVLRALGDEDAARTAYFDVLARIDASDDASRDLEVRRIEIDALLGLGRVHDALPRLREAVQQSPRDLDLVLDYVDALVAVGAHDEADRLVRHARNLDPTAPRVLQTAAWVATERGDVASAIEFLGRSLDAPAGDDEADVDRRAALFAERARLHERTGAWEDALDDARRWRHLVADRAAGREAAGMVGRLEDRIATIGIGQVEFRRVEDDVSVASSIGGSVRFDRERTRIVGRLGHASFSGRAAAVGAGQVDLEADVGTIDLEAFRAIGESGRFGGGVSVAAGAPGEVDVGAHLSLRLARQEPYGQLDAHAFVNELWSDPIAAVALEGRQSGLELLGYQSVGDRAWISGSARIRALEARVPSMPRTRDTEVSGELSVGWRLLSGGPAAVADRVRFGRLLSEPQSPFAGGLDRLDRMRGWNAQAWLSVQAQELLGDGALAGVLPVASESRFALAAGRVERQVGADFGASLEAFVGSDLERADAVWGLDLGMSWRPAAPYEFTLLGGRGESLSRSGGDTASYRAFLQFVMRW